MSGNSSFSDVPDFDTLELERKINTFPYSDVIKNPTELGTSGYGLAYKDDIKNLKSYVQLLLDGGGPATKVSGPLGYKYFLSTGTKCKNIADNKLVSRSIYINNLPSANENYGLIPSAQKSISNLDPLSTYKALITGNNPDCKLISLETTNPSTGMNSIPVSKYLTTIDIKSLEAFQNYNPQLEQSEYSIIIRNIYFISLAILVCYILTKK